jgi:hypothetical protein
MLKKASSVVLASLKTSTYRKTYASAFRSLWLATGKARVSTRAGWVGGTAAFLTILHPYSHFAAALPS